MARGQTRALQRPVVVSLRAIKRPKHLLAVKDRLSTGHHLALGIRMRKAASIWTTGLHGILWMKLRRRFQSCLALATRDVYFTGG
eukprot:s1881_g12.t1